jgi:3-dehydroquinate synthase
MYDTTVKFPFPAAHCRLVAGQGAASKLRSVVSKVGCSTMFIVTDRNVNKHYESQLREYLNGVRCPGDILVLPAGERTKSYRYQLKIHDWLLKKGADRESILIGVGGGVICDITGFAAATFMRGIRHALIATTLVAQIDAAIGGKNGINLPAAKNIVGTIKQPVSVIADSMFLRTLRSQHLREGMAELVKIALIKSASLGKLITHYQSSHAEDREELISRIIQQGVKLKLDVVRKDPFESGLRKILNFGHTTGHALEALGKYRQMTHGRAVACGMLVALELSRRLCSLDDETVAWGTKRIRELYRSFPIAGISPDGVWEVIKRDKKRVREQIRFVLLESFAKPVIHTVTERQFRSSFDRVTKSWSGKP